MSRLKSSPGSGSAAWTCPSISPRFSTASTTTTRSGRCATRKRGCASSCRTAGANSTAAETNWIRRGPVSGRAVFWGEAGHLARNRRRAGESRLRRPRGTPAQETSARRVPARRKTNERPACAEKRMPAFCVANRARRTSGSPPRILILGGRKIAIP